MSHAHGRALVENGLVIMERVATVGHASGLRSLSASPHHAAALGVATIPFFFLAN
jgi:hypothetical protein